MRRALLLVLLTAAAGCGSDQGDMDFGGDEIGPDLYAVESREGQVKMGLTDRYVYFGLTEQATEEARAEMDQEFEDKEGLGGMLGGVMNAALGKALSFRVKYPITAIRDIRWDAADSVMVLDFEEGGRRLDEDVMKVDDRPVTEAFDREAVEAFAEEFRRAKRGDGG